MFKRNKAGVFERKTKQLQHHSTGLNNHPSSQPLVSGITSQRRVVGSNFEFEKASISEMLPEA